MAVIDNRGKPLPNDHPLAGTTIILGGRKGWDAASQDPQPTETDSAVEPAAHEPSDTSLPEGGSRSSGAELTDEKRTFRLKVASIFASLDGIVAALILLLGYGLLISTRSLLLIVLAPFAFLAVAAVGVQQSARIRSAAPRLLVSLWDRAAPPAWFVIKAAVLVLFVAVGLNAWERRGLAADDGSPLPGEVGRPSLMLEEAERTAAHNMGG